MSEEVQETLVEYVKNQAKMIASLHISWYGGEHCVDIDVVVDVCPVKG